MLALTIVLQLNWCWSFKLFTDILTLLPGSVKLKSVFSLLKLPVEIVIEDDGS